MEVFVRVFGIVVILCEVLLCVKPELFRKVIPYFNTRQRLYAGVVAKIAVGVLLVAAGPACSVPAVIVIVGMIMVLLNVGMFLVNIDDVLAFMQAIARQNDLFVRILGAVGALFGLLLVIAG